VPRCWDNVHTSRLFCGTVRRKLIGPCLPSEKGRPWWRALCPLSRVPTQQPAASIAPAATCERAPPWLPPCYPLPPAAAATFFTPLQSDVIQRRSGWSGWVYGTTGVAVSVQYGCHPQWNVIASFLQPVTGRPGIQAAHWYACVCIMLAILRATLAE